MSIIYLWKCQNCNFGIQVNYNSKADMPKYNDAVFRVTKHTHFLKHEVIMKQNIKWKLKGIQQDE